MAFNFFFYFLYIKISKDSSARYYKKKDSKKSCERYQNYPEKDKKQKMRIWSQTT